MSLTRNLGLPREDALMSERFGVEVETENMPDHDYIDWREGRPSTNPHFAEAARQWAFVEDGSLRHNGLELVSRPMTADEAEARIPLVGNLLERGLVTAGPRTGVHVHVNVRHMELDRVVQLLCTYTVVEPLLFQVVGEERAHSIYCVPWYSGRNEPETLARMVSAVRRGEFGSARQILTTSCKYSALFAGPMLKYGTVEFRHAPTYSTTRGLMDWFRLVRDVSRLRHAGSVQDMVSAMPVILGPSLTPWQIDWQRYYADVKRYDLVGLANAFQPCTYKAKPWGKPASLLFSPVLKAAPRVEDEDYPDDYDEDHDGDDEEESEEMPSVALGDLIDAPPTPPEVSRERAELARMREQHERARTRAAQIRRGTVRIDPETRAVPMDGPALRALRDEIWTSINATEEHT